MERDTVEHAQTEQKLYIFNIYFLKERQRQTQTQRQERGKETSTEEKEKYL